MLEGELLADSSKFAARFVRRGYLESVRGIDRSASLSEEDVAVWARSLQGQVRSGQSRIATWADAKGLFRTWGVQRGVIRHFAPPEEPP